MSHQLVIHVNRAQTQWRWCWLDETGRPLLDSAASGDLDTLVASLGEAVAHEAWLLLPADSVITRECGYEEAEKRHLRRLLPYQLEEQVIGDIDQFHFAPGPAREGRALVAYCERDWLRVLLESLTERRIEVHRATPLPLCLPLPADPALSEQYPHWTLQWQDEQLLVRYAPNLGYAINREQAGASLQLLLNAQNRVDNLPRLTLRAQTDAELVALEALLPEELKSRVEERELVAFWQLDFAGAGELDLCQGEFSRRLPLGRWWYHWQGVVAAAAACLLVYVGATVYQVRALEQENIDTRRQIESVYREVAGEGNLVDAERQLRQRLNELEPGGSGVRVTPLLGKLFPALAEADGVTVSAISFSSRAGELSLNIRAGAFNAIEQLRGAIQSQGLEAELLSASAQGNSHSARLRVSSASGDRS